MDITFITVNYNTKQLVKDLINFFGNTPFPFSHDLVVVDNKSSDGSAELIANTSGITGILNQDNVGYGRAVNQGVEATAGKYVCVLNTDLILNRDALVALWEYLETHQDAGLACPLICDPGTMNIQNFVFHENMIELYVDSVFRWKGRSLKNQLSSAKTPVPVEGVMGSFIFMRRSLIENNKIFDEAFNFYYEDNDLAHRLKKRGVACMVLPQQHIVHLGGQSSSGLSTNQVFLKNRYKYLLKHYGSSHARNIFMLDYFRAWVNLLKYRLRSGVLGRESDSRKAAAMQTSCNELKKLLTMN
jgi:N-acetylglucosaminyl-diphospho-decaprenol L-rhamnosyltransferase